MTTPDLALPGELPSTRRLASAAAYPVLVVGLLLVLAGYGVLGAALLRLVWP